MNTATFQRFVNRHRLEFAIAAVISLALLMTTISLSLYITSGTSNLDLSRPGYEQIREQITSSKPSQLFEANGPMSETVLTDFKKLFDAQQSAFIKLDDFKDESLSDASLQLAPAPMEAAE